MATQRPGAPRPTTPRADKPHTSTSRDSAQWHDLGADTVIWHTRGLQSSTRMRAPAARRTPPQQLPPSQVPKLILWTVLIGIALVCFHAVKRML
ncbi:hypothetical protein SAMN04488595_11458 [Ralstonia sp. 25mfcol4.1]|uniref:hypothetical protein n=1 Tax=Burkholderiaceae TaxID=119060 RepID=UPI0008803439|nr:hypothetical protein [Ralstonia sp. 25mfcol4.1]SDP63291.1 hypothetical protein SAMN04488595_11458 [Ralstonia sp. 25mfcol4.1]